MFAAATSRMSGNACAAGNRHHSGIVGRGESSRVGAKCGAAFVPASPMRLNKGAGDPVGRLFIGLLEVLIVAYVHHEIPKFTRGGIKREVAHGVLIAAGLMAGVASVGMPGLPIPRWLAFATGFSIVHVPAAIILSIKYWKGSGQS